MIKHLTKREIEDSVYDYLSYIPISKSVEKLKRWKQQRAEIQYFSALKVGKKIKENRVLKKEELKIDKIILRKYGFPKGKIFHRNEEETYAEIAERVLPDVLIEDDCESIGGSKEMVITFVKPEIKRKIKSIIVKEFSGIDHLPDKLNDLLNYND